MPLRAVPGAGGRGVDPATRGGRGGCWGHLRLQGGGSRRGMLGAGWGVPLCAGGPAAGGDRPGSPVGAGGFGGPDRAVGTWGVWGMGSP